MEGERGDIQNLRRQLGAFAQFTTRAMGELDVDALMMDGCIRARGGLNTSHAKLLEYLPERDRLLMRAGVGWKEGYVNRYQIPPDLDTPIGHAFALSDPVAISDYVEVRAYKYPVILKEHGCISSLNVPIRTDRGMFGVLEVDDTSVRAFTSDDIHFLMGLGNTIGRAIELNRAMTSLAKNLEEKQLLLREMNHRIKNNLALIAAMLSLQAKNFREATVKDEFRDAVLRINNLALVHDRLQLFSTTVTEIDAATHFGDLCQMLRSLLPQHVSLSSECSGMIYGDSAEALTLMANELVTNAAKHAFVGREKGQIVIGYCQNGIGWKFHVRDNGCGVLPDGDDKEPSFGWQLVDALALRLNAQVFRHADEGTRIEVVCDGGHSSAGSSGTGAVTG